jgi:hypothetical protein
MSSPPGGDRAHDTASVLEFAPWISDRSSRRGTRMSDTIDTISEKLHPSNLALSAVDNVDVRARHRPHDYW